jgi:hypothetical protein
MALHALRRGLGHGQKRYPEHSVATTNRPTGARSGDHTHGEVLRRGLMATMDRSPAVLVLAEEAARIADRLDRLAEQLDGRAWLRMRTQDIAAGMDSRTVTVKVIFAAALAESRQQALTLKGILAEVGRQGDAKK